MPTLQLTIPQGDLNSTQKADIIERMTNTISQFYLDEQNENLKPYINVQISEAAEGGYAVGGEIIG